MIFKKIRLFALALFLLVMACGSKSDDITGTETTNGNMIANRKVTVKVHKTISGTAPHNSTIILCTYDYDKAMGKGFIDTLVVDKSKKFTFSQVEDNMIYTLFAFLEDESIRFDDLGLPVKSEHDPNPAPKNYADTLRTGITLSGKIKDSDKYYKYTVRLKGTPFHIDIPNGKNSFVIENVPLGNYQVLLEGVSTDIGGQTEVFEGDTLFLQEDNPEEWKDIILTHKVAEPIQIQ